jgi:hypothetical protein
VPLKPTEVHITGPRGAEIERILGRRTFAVKSPLPCRAIVADRGEADVYLLDIDTLTDAEMNALARHFAEKFGGEPRAVKDEMRDCGVPILAEDCVVAIDMRHFL